MKLRITFLYPADKKLGLKLDQVVEASIVTGTECNSFYVIKQPKDNVWVLLNDQVETVNED